MFCPCHGKRWGEPESKIEYDMAPPSVTRTLSMRSKENAEASREAEEQARRDREMLSRENPEVMPGVRKSAIDTINERANDII